MKDDISFLEGKGANAVVRVKGYNSTSAGKKASEVGTSVSKKEPDGSTSGVAAWGNANDYPQKLLKELEKSGSAGSGLNLRKWAHYGNGLIYYTSSVEDGKKKLQLVDEDAIGGNFKELKRNSQLNRFFKECIADLETFSIAFPEYVLSNDGNTITRVKRQQAAFCRFALMNDKGDVENVYISSEWEDGPSVDSEKVKEVAHIDSYCTAEEAKEICKKKNIKKFIKPVMLPMMSTSYYPTTAWHSVYKNKWLEVAADVPELKKNVFKNQATILYHIEVTVDYFERKYKGQWENFTVKEKEQYRDELLQEINQHLSGVENTHKSILSLRYKDDAGDYVEGITIKAIDNKYKDGAYLPEASAANSEILFALGVDPTLIGAGVPGGKLGGGGGSDKREAYTILSALMKSPRDTTLEIYDFIRDFNGWTEEVHAGFENTVLTTLDANPTGTENTTNA